MAFQSETTAELTRAPYLRHDTILIEPQAFTFTCFEHPVSPRFFVRRSPFSDISLFFLPSTFHISLDLGSSPTFHHTAFVCDGHPDGHADPALSPHPLFGRFSTYSIPYKCKAPGSGSENESPNTTTINSTNSKTQPQRRQLQLDEDYDGDGGVEEKLNEKMAVVPVEDVKEEQVEGEGKDVDAHGDHEMVDAPSSPTTVTTAATKIDSPVAIHSPSLKTFDPPVVEEVKLGTPGAKDDSESREMKVRQMVDNVDEDAQGEGDGDAEDVEKGIIACEACGELISVRDEDKAGAFTMKYWETHQGVWCVSFFCFRFLSFLISLFCFISSRFRSLLRPCLLSSLRFRSSLLRVLPCHLREHRRAASFICSGVTSSHRTPSAQPNRAIRGALLHLPARVVDVAIAGSNPTSVSRFFPLREGKRDPTPTFSPAISGGSTRYFGQGRFSLGGEDVGICPVLGKRRLVLG